MFLQEAEEGAETAIDPGGAAVCGSPPVSQAAEAEEAQVLITEPEGEAPAGAGEQEEVGMRRLSLQAVGGVTKEREVEEVKTQEEGGSADSEQAATETDGEEGI